MKIKEIVYWSVFGLVLLMLSVSVMISLLASFDLIFDIIPKETNQLDIISLAITDMVLIIILVGWSMVMGT